MNENLAVAQAKFATCLNLHILEFAVAVFVLKCFERRLVEA
ncbi:MAG: hypothetical protein XE11_2243, partial [Methanomicrobiales archaeon 53_19]